jgi:hypothetical protein
VKSIGGRVEIHRSAAGEIRAPAATKAREFGRRPDRVTARCVFVLADLPSVENRRSQHRVIEDELAAAARIREAQNRQRRRILWRVQRLATRLDDERAARQVERRARR